MRPMSTGQQAWMRGKVSLSYPTTLEASRSRLFSVFPISVSVDVWQCVSRVAAHSRVLVSTMMLTP